ncbi:MAG TPA: 2OG-Fe(II) oxygenase, partial [Variovorax sp.]
MNVRENLQAPSALERIEAIDRAQLEAGLDDQGCTLIEGLLAPDECRALAGLYARRELFRSRVVMERHGFGRGEYQYFEYPLPERVVQLRTALYAQLAPIANRWQEAMGLP